MNIETTSADFRTADTGVATLFGEDAGIYYVMREDGRAPRFQHHTRHSATKEAIRLAAKHPGANFHVVKLKNTFQKAADPKPTHAEKVKAERDKQSAARDKFAIGQTVKVVDTHYSSAGVVGVVAGFHSHAPIVFVTVNGEPTVRRFAPSSLIVVETPETAEPAQAPTEPAPAPAVIKVGDIVIDQAGIEAEVHEIRADEGRAFVVHDGRLCRWISIDELRLHPSGSRADALAGEHAQVGAMLDSILDAFVNAAIRRDAEPAERFERDTPVYVLVGGASLNASYAVEAVVYAYAGNGMDMWVVVEGPDGPVKKIVKIEQVIARDDQRFKVIKR
jgi:hypothetical protein